MQSTEREENPKIVSAILLVSSLGYFVDMYDLLLFNIVRVKSLHDLGVNVESSASQGLFLMNAQMAGMLFGGLIFGVMGDRLGRLKALYTSIFLYSCATLANAFVSNMPTYAVLRFFAGLGLAGELGCGVTLACESIDDRRRGWGPVLIASIGFFGAILAFFVSEWTHWRNAYLLGGLLGFSLLFLRIRIHESKLFNEAQSDHRIVKGSLKLLFRKRALFLKLTRCVGLGLPIWFIGGILVALSPEFGKEFHLDQPVSAGRAILFLYSGTIIGDLASGLLSQWMQSRKKAIFVFIAFCALGVGLFLSGWARSTSTLYWLVGLMGFSTGYWALLITVAAEQFGTNLRATAATSVPNFVRGSLILTSAVFLSLRSFHLSMVAAGAITGLLTLSFALFSILGLDETFSRSLAFHDVFDEPRSV